MKDYPLDNIFCMIREAVEAARSEGFERGRGAARSSPTLSEGRFTWKTRGGDLAEIQQIVTGAGRPFRGRIGALARTWLRDGRTYEGDPRHRDDLMVPDWFKF